MAGPESIVSGMAGRYATALFELARDEKSIDAVKADLEAFEALLNDSEDLRRLVRSPVFSADEQTKALAAVIAKAGWRFRLRNANRMSLRTLSMGISNIR